MVPETGCRKDIYFDTEIKAMFPNVGPLSIGTSGSGLEFQWEGPGWEVSHYAGVPPHAFDGFDCITLIMKNYAYDGEVEHIAVHFQEGEELMIKIHSEVITEYVFNSGRMAVSPAYEAKSYIEYDYLTSTLTVDAKGRQMEYFIVRVDEAPMKDDPWFCSHHLEPNGEPIFLRMTIIFSSWFTDVTNRIRGNFLSFGSVIGTLLFWASFFIIVGASLSAGLVQMIKRRTVSLLIFCCLILILATIVYMRILFYDANCPLF
jgi:hypothetical protein